MKYVLIQTAIGDYRQNVLSIVSQKLGDEFTILCGHEYFEESTKTRINIKNVRYIDNIFFYRRKFLFQKDCMRAGIKAESVILELNPRIVNVWLIIFARKLLGRKTVLWGHAWPRDGKMAKSDRVRNVLRNLADILILYTKKQAVELKEKKPRSKLIVAPNSLYFKDDMWCKHSQQRDFIYVGRLIKQKKPELMIKAFIAFTENNEDSTLIIVGDGPEKARLEKIVENNNLNDRIKFKGHISDLGTLRQLYGTAVASVSPGYVGLSITQSLSFGVPMIISKNENHAPEIEAAKEGFNTEFFNTDSAQDLASKYQYFYENKSLWSERAESIINDCKDNYTAEKMADSIIKAFQDG